MKKLLLLAAVILAGCDFSDDPTCYSEFAQEWLLSRYVTNNSTSERFDVKKIEGIIEKSDNTCVAFVTLENDAIVQFNYIKPHYLNVFGKDGKISKIITMADEPGETIFTFKFIDSDELPDAFK